MTISYQKVSFSKSFWSWTSHQTFSNAPGRSLTIPDEFGVDYERIIAGLLTGFFCCNAGSQAPVRGVSTGRALDSETGPEIANLYIWV